MSARRIPGVGNNHGWEVVIGGLPRGSTMIQAYGIDTSNRPNDYIELGTRWVNVTCAAAAEAARSVWPVK